MNRLTPRISTVSDVRVCHEQLERLDIRFCWIDSITARTRRVEREQRERADQEKAKGAKADA